MPPESEAHRIEALTTALFTAVVGDVLDRLGFHNQFLPPGLAPLDPSTRIAGRAMTVLQADIDPAVALPSALAGADKPFGLMLEALDDLKAGEIYVATGGTVPYALWGGLMSTRAQHLGAVGAVLDGYVRDSEEIAGLGFPVFARGLYAQDQAPRGRVVDFRVPVTIGGVAIAPGDLVFGDREGVLVIPRQVEDEALARAVEKATTENKVAHAIRSGMSAVEAFATFGVM